MLDPSMSPPAARGSREDATSWIRQWFRSLPLFTKSTFILILATYLLQLLLGEGISYSLCLQTKLLVEHLQVWRIFTSVIVHGGLLHIVFNMLAFIPIGQSMEQAVGTVQFSHLVLVLTIVEAALYSTIAYALALSRLYPNALHSCVVGLSGVIFGLIVVDNAKLPEGTQRSIFGFFSIPAQAYPWALLLLWQLLMPGASFIAHLSGLLVGQMWVHGQLSALSLPRSSTTWLEGTWLQRTSLLHHPAFVTMPPGTLPLTSHDTSRAGAPAGGERGTWTSGAILPASLAGLNSSSAFSRIFSWGQTSSSGSAASSSSSGAPLLLGGASGGSSHAAVTGQALPWAQPPAPSAARAMQGDPSDGQGSKGARPGDSSQGPEPQAAAAAAASAAAEARAVRAAAAEARAAKAAAGTATSNSSRDA